MKTFPLSLSRAGVPFCFPIALIAFLILISPQRAHAQALSGMTGTVTDNSGAVVPGANVTVTNDDTGVARHAVTTSVWGYSVTDLIPGTYTVKFDKAGFQTAVQKNTIVEAGGKKTTVDAI